MVIKFDLSDIPENSEIEEAVLSLYVYQGYDSWGNGLKTLHTITESWDESSVTWNSKPDYNSSEIAQCNGSSINVWEEYDVTEEIKEIIENNKDNYGFMLRYGDSYTGAYFRSSEYSSIEYRPKLTVTYLGDEAFIEIKSPNGGEEIEQNSICPIVWSDNIEGDVKIELYQNSTLIETIADATESNGSYEWQVPADLTPGDDYSIKIINVDSTDLLDESSQPFSIVSEFFISEFPYVQNFDNMEIGNSRALSENWEQLDEDDIDWIVHTGPTPSKTGSDPDKTGPDADHTSGNGNYVYVEASDPNNPQKEAGMITPKFNLNITNDPVLQFWVHMFSAENEMGDLYVDINIDGTWNNDVIHLTDDHGDAWFEVTEDLSSYMGDRVRFRFRGITGDSWCSDICVDDFKIDGATAITGQGNKSALFFSLKHCDSWINFQIPEKLEKKHVDISIYTVQGKLINTIVNGNMNAGYHSVHLDNISKNDKQLGSGIYLCRMEAGGFTETISIIVGK